MIRMALPIAQLLISKTQRQAVAFSKNITQPCYYNNNNIKITNTLRPHFSTTAMSNSDSSPKTVRVEIKGRVQGVFYRNWTIENARELGLNGWVRNRRDGSVEALFSGSPDKVDEMQQRCRRGPSDAMVTSLTSSPSADVPGPGFDRRPTV